MELPTYRIARGGRTIEQLNIEGKRSGQGFLAHKAVLVNALSRALAERAMFLDLTIGRKGFLTYLKSLGGSNIVKIVPSNGDASVSRVAGKCLKVVCGSSTSYLDNMAWVGEKTPLTLCDIRVSPRNSVSPNLGAIELSDALSRVLPFTSDETSRPILQCVLFRVKDGKLTLVAADGYRLAVLSLPFDGDEGQVLVSRDELSGVTGALRRARRVRLSLEQNGDKDPMSLVLDTELIRYTWRGCGGSFPDYEKLIPAETNTRASFDTNEAMKAVSTLKVVANVRAYALDLAIGDGKVVVANTDDRGTAEIPADTTGEPIKVRLDGGYLAEALRACGGMVELKVKDARSPMLFTAPDYELVVMPMLLPEAKKPADTAKTAEPAKADTAPPPAEPTEPKAETVEAVAPEATAEPVPAEEVAQAVAEAEAITKAEKPKAKKHSKAKEPVAVA
ncbi:DNA polymerase III beta subunit, central domain [Dehalogenimonas formicexedens]|uniref:DNA polymerase III beta subunit, central domain n=1 Tax=Dehalogenimonas formicexedens TaxID=1839801 RepID=A0A1P8F5B4_9CHLR|nr:DNA polymerase III subunit beta [Dehalogenimonas formicexedens]APV43664.1 DNA polymerase III beta subunit, central domain [Dehalogenimonas formicexedens]